jgi:hypothetical protein
MENQQHLNDNIGPIYMDDKRNKGYKLVNNEGAECDSKGDLLVANTPQTITLDTTPTTAS